ncbi:hypothetical protein IAT40_007780 [Kwoniella sp. CBS 6097]
MSALLEESYIVSPASGSSSTGKSASPPILPPPVESYQLRQTICGIETELLVQTFDDRVFVVITQNGKVGCLTQASLPNQIPLPPPPPPSASASASASNPSSSLQILSILPPPPPALSLTPLLGSPPNPTLHDLYTSQIATLVFFALESGGNPRRPVVVGLSLKRISASSSSAGSASHGDVDEQGDDDRDEGGIGLSDEERARYAGIMELVSQWPGPSS